jgi:hypothetical protein
MTVTDIELIPQESGSPIPLEAGVYAVVVSDVEEAEGKQYGEQVKLFLQTVDETDDDGEPYELWAWASKKLTTRSKLFRWTANITGSLPVLGEPFRIREALIGRPCRAQISEVTGEDGTVRKKVSDVLPPSKPKAAAKPPEPDTCSDCSTTVAYYAADGKPFCEAHGPRAAS